MQRWQWLWLAMLLSYSPLGYGGEHQKPSTIDAQLLGANGGDDKDDTEALQKAVDLAALTGRPIFLGAGTYLLKSKGNRHNAKWGKLAYALLLEKRKNVDLRFTGPGIISIPISDDKPCNALVAYKCENIRISGLRVQSVGPPPQKKRLYTHYAAMLVECTDFMVTDLWAKDIAGAVLAIECTRGEISKSSSKTCFVGLRGMHFGTLGSSFVTISDCRAEGGTGDGDIFHFGSGRRNRIVNCVAINTTPPGRKPFFIAQGIGIDSGQRFSSIENCYAEGYYYGIDIKTEAIGARVFGNTLTSNKVGIAIRRGEGNRPTVVTEVRRNWIFPVAGNGAKILPNGAMAPDCAWGIWLNDAMICSVTENFIGFGPLQSSGDFQWVGIKGVSSEKEGSGSYNQAAHVDLADNIFELAKDYGGRSCKTSGNAIELTGNGSVSIHENTIIYPYKTDRPIRILLEKFSRALLSNNIVAPGLAKPPFALLKDIESTSCFGNLPGGTRFISETSQPR